jgi:hypothetical protein
MKIEDEWKKFIQRNHLENNINLLDIEYYFELKNAFYAGASSTLLGIDNISSKDTDEFNFCMSDFVNELIDYWNN